MKEHRQIGIEGLEWFLAAYSELCLHLYLRENKTTCGGGGNEHHRREADPKPSLDSGALDSPRSAR